MRAWVKSVEIGRVVPGVCIICGRPLPRLRWWQRNALMAPPPFHDPQRDPACRLPGVEW